MKKMNNIKQFLFILLAFAFLGVNQVWGATLTAKTAVASGSGTARVETMDGNTSKDSKSTGGSSLVTASMTVNGGLFGIGKTEGYSKFTATASSGYYFVAWYTNSACTTGEQKANPYSTSKTTSSRTDTYYAKFAPYTYTVTFNANGGGQDATTKTVTFASEYGDLPDLTRRFYTFDGWFTEEGTQITPSTIVNTASDHTLYAHWTFKKEDQTLSWGEGMLFNMAKDTRQAIAVASTSGLTEFTYESDHEGVVKVNGEYLEAVGSGEATITVHQAGNEYFNSAILTGKFVVSSKETPNFAPNGFSADETCELKVGQTVILSLANVSDGLDGDFTVVASTDNLIDIVREGNSITFTAAHAGETTITVAQAETEGIYAASKSYTFNVTRYVPEFTLSDTELVLDQTATLSLTNVDGESISFNPEGIVSYDGGTGVITAVAAGTTTLTVSQAETNSIEAKESTFAINVSKKTPTLSVKMNGTARTSLTVYQGNIVTLSFDVVSDAEVEVTTVSGGQYASYKDGKLLASTELGTAKFLATLPETDTYKGASVEFTLTVQKDNRHLPITMSNTLWNNSSFVVESEGDNSWDSSKGIVLGDATGGGANWDDKYVVLHFEGIPDKLSFDIAGDACSLCQTLGGITNSEWYIQESATAAMSGAKIWTSSQTSTTFTSYTIQLDPTTRYIKLCFSGNFGGDFRNVKITELKYVENPEPASIDFGTAVINSGEVLKTVNVNWCNIAPMAVTSSNPRFTVSPTSFGTYDALGSQELTIRFEHTNEIGTQEADITISNGNATYTKTVHVQATTTKRPQAIVWNQALAATGFAMNVDESYPDATIDPIATTASGARITFESDNSDVIEIVADTIIYAKAAGTANVTAYQEGDNQYAAAQDTKEFTVTLLMKQTIEWEQNLMGLLTTSEPVELTATATSGGEITYVSADEDVVRVEGNTLIIVGEGETTITATQAGGVINEQEWLSVSQHHTVVVRNPASQCNEQALVQGSLTLSSSMLSKEYELAGTPTTLTFSALHGTKSNGAWLQKPTYAALMVDQYAKIDGTWGWQNIYNQVVGTDATASGTINLNETATKIRFRTTETETTHTISDIRVPRKKYMRADVTSLDAEVECNAIWSKTITVAHSNIDVMTLTTQQGLLQLNKATLGDGCGSYGDDEFIVSFTPQKKYEEYTDVIVITDSKADPTTIEIPVRLYSKGLNQSISGFELPTTAVATDEIEVAATASSELEVTFTSSDDEIAYVADGKLVILSAGTVTITASQEGNEKYDAAPSIEKTIVISKAATSITTAPTAEAITYGQSLEASALVNGTASVDGTFAWEAPAEVPAAGTPTYNVIFTPEQSAIYATATTLVSVRVEKATPEVTTAPTASDITIAQALSNSELTGGEASVPGTFVWKNPNESRLPAGAYERIVIFTPENANYNTVEMTVAFNVVNVYAKITEMPVAVIDSAVYGLTLADVELQGGAANVDGSFAWKDSTVALQAGTHDYLVRFTPEDLELYASVDAPVQITVAKAIPAIVTLPEAAALTYGQMLNASALSEGETTVPGAFNWLDGDTLLPAGIHTMAVVFIPADSANYETLSSEVNVTVNKAQLTITANDTVVVYGNEAPAFSVTYEGFVNGEDENTEFVLTGELAFACDYTNESAMGEYAVTPSGLQAYNYEITFVSGTLTVGKAAAYGIILDPVPAENLVADGQELVLIQPGEAENNATILYSLDGIDFAEELPTATKAGSYVIFYYVAGDEIHQDGEVYYIEVTVDADMSTPTAIDNSSAEAKAVKIIRDNQVLIIRNGRTYTVSGQLVE